MKKKIIKRSLLGFSLGITMGYLITILISLGWANGYYSPCVPELISLMGNEINAVILQTIPEWNIDDTFCNGILLFGVNEDIYPKKY